MAANFVKGGGGLELRFTADTASMLKGFKAVTKGLAKVGKTATLVGARVAKSVGKMIKGFTRLTGTVVKWGSAMGAAFAGLSTKVFVDFERGMAEVSTLVDTTTVDMAKLERGVRSLAKAFGQDQLLEAQALYNAISAGVSNADDALGILEVSNRAAIAGVTDVNTALRGIVQTLNAYGVGMDRAEDVADIFFQTVKEGVLTFPQLAEGLGPVVAIAAQAEVGLVDLTAALATLTKGGIPFEIAATGLRNVMNSFIKPTDEAAEAAERLGIELGAGALKRRGLLGAIQSVSEAVKRSADPITDMTKLFGNIRAFTAIAPLAGRQSEEFARISESIGNWAGASSEAFEKMSKTLGFAMSRMWVQFKDLGISIGKFLAPAIAAVTEGLRGATEAFQGFVEIAAQDFAPMRDSIVAAFAAIGDAIRPVWELFLRFFDTFMGVRGAGGGIADALGIAGLETGLFDILNSVMDWITNKILDIWVFIRDEGVKWLAFFGAQILALIKTLASAIATAIATGIIRGAEMVLNNLPDRLKKLLGTEGVTFGELPPVPPRRAGEGRVGVGPGFEGGLPAGKATGGGGQVNVVINVDSLESQETIDRVAQKVGEEVRKAARRGQAEPMGGEPAPQPF